MTSQQQMGGKTFSTVVVVRVPLHWIEFICMCINLVAQMVKNLPAMQETMIQSLGLEDPMEMETATHSVFLPEEFHGQRSLAGYGVAKKQTGLNN